MSENTDGKNVKIFISYAREDYETAKKLYNDLKTAGAEPWMDKIDILPGQWWKTEISSAIRNCQYFLLLLSSTSVSKQGFVHKEMRIALEVLESLPQSEIFLIPVRTDECRPPNEMLEELQWVDLFPFYEEGLEKILRAVKNGQQMMIADPGNKKSPQKQKKDRDRGNKAAWKILAVLIVFTAAYLLVNYVEWKRFFSPKKYRLTIITDPADAKVRIADPEMAYSPGIQLLPGSYQIEVSHPGFETETWKIEIKAKDFSEPVVRLKRKLDNTKPVTGKPDKPVSPVEPVKEEIQNTEPFTNSIGMKFVYIKLGTFMMGSPKEEPGHQDDETQHEVTLTKGFYMQTTEVTQGQWQAVMGNKPSYFKDCGDNCPVEQVYWYEAQEFIKKLNQKEGKNLYRLPTEAEWEYAARAGTDTPFAFGKCLSTDQANYDGNSYLEGCPKGTYRGKPVSVGSLKANDRGLYDMHGNVWEWCQDWYGGYPANSVTNPEGPGTGSNRVNRGGGWFNNAVGCRSADRNGSSPDSRGSGIGFRLVLSPGQQ